jgi:uncharacterized protein YndB with AHSA1/START domain
VTTTLPRAADYTTTITADAPPETVFAALTIPAHLAAWWAPATGHGAEGGELRFDMHSPQGPLVIRVHSAEHPRVLVWNVLSCPFLPDWEGTTITFDLGRNDRGGCDLFFRHHGLTPQLDCYDTCRQGWNHFIPSLRQYVDTGTGNPRGSDADTARRANTARLGDEA